MTPPARARLIELARAGHVGDVHVARAALTDADPASRELGLAGLHRMGSLSLDELAAAMTDAHPVVRRRAVEMAAATALPLVDSLADADDTVAEAAAFACGERVDVDDATLLAVVRLATDHDAPLVREAAVAALGAIGDQRGVPAILRGCADKPAVRRRAVLALAPFDGDEVERAIDAALTDRDWQVRQAAEDLRRAQLG